MASTQSFGRSTGIFIGVLVGCLVAPAWSLVCAEEAPLSPSTPSESPAVDPASSPHEPATPSAEFSAPSPDVPAPAAATTPEETVTTHVEIAGNIWRMKPGLVFLRTPIGLMTLTCKTCLRELRGNPTITLYVQGAQGALSIAQRGAESTAPRYLWGPVTYSGPDKKELVFWTPDGEKRFAAEPVASKLLANPKGGAVTVEVNESGKLVGVHDLQYDLQVSQIPSHSNRTEMKVTGSVAKIKNGYVHVQTDLGVLPISAKTGLCLAKDRCHTKVGEELALWIHDTTAAFDLYPKGSNVPARRLLSGKLAYVGSDKTALSLWTPEGEQSFPTDRARGSLASLKEGAPIVLELDGSGAVQEIRKGN